MPSTYNAPSPLHGVGRTLGGTGVPVSAQPAWGSGMGGGGSFMLNRGGATLIPTSSKTEQARRDLRRPHGPFLAPS